MKLIFDDDGIFHFPEKSNRKFRNRKEGSGSFRDVLLFGWRIKLIGNTEYLEYTIQNN
jgi:hypothetical protein